MAAYQGTKDDAWRDEHPGKIMHELRFGEFAGMGAVPHTPYYGTIDATLLFLMLFAETMRWTGDQALYHALLPAVERALDWIDAYGDVDGDGYVDFQPRSGGGLSIQGWKDSQDSVQYPDGRLGEPPIALVEVQAYAYAAKTAVAALLRQMGGDTERADRLEASAATLREQFNRDFWLPDLGFYAQVLDGHKQALPELTSNVGHALLGGILTEERARQVAERLLRPDMASGWGIRTRASSDIAYNPMSYHNGSIWPHDNSLIIWGMQRSGLRDAVEYNLRADLRGRALLSTHALAGIDVRFRTRGCSIGRTGRISSKLLTTGLGGRHAISYTTKHPRPGARRCEQCVDGHAASTGLARTDRGAQPADRQRTSQLRRQQGRAGDHR